MSLENAPLKTLDILSNSMVTTDNCVLRENQDTIIGRGTLDTMVAQRDEILKIRGFRVPERWDHSWNYKLGPVWTPTSLIHGHHVYWFKPDGMRPETNNAGLCVEWTAERGSINMTQNTTTRMPALVNDDTGIRGFNYLEWADGAEQDFIQMETAAVTGPEFLIVMMVDLDDAPDEEVTIITKGASPNVSNSWSLKVDYSGTNKDLIWKVGSNTLTHTMNGDGETIISCGQIDIGGSRYRPFIAAYDGRSVVSDMMALTGSANSITSNGKVQIGRSIQLVSDPDYLQGIKIYEIIIYDEDTVSNTNVPPNITTWRDLITGYLASKYHAKKLLPSAHTYKEKIPRASIT